MRQGKAEIPTSYWQWHVDPSMLRVLTDSLHEYAIGLRSVTSDCVSPKMSDASSGTDRRVSVGCLWVGYQRRVTTGIGIYADILLQRAAFLFFIF